MTTLSLRSLIRQDEPRQGVALFAKGFRPLFLCAGLYGVLAVPLFLLELGGHLQAGAYLLPTYWHAHEMIFGFTGAVLGGFLLTAVTNWTGRATAEGAALAALAASWVAGRIGMLLPDHLPRYAPALLDLAFLPAVLVACARPIFATGNRRNYAFLGILGVLIAANTAVHASALGILSLDWQRRASWVALDILVVVLMLITGRVVPMFTRNALGASNIRSEPGLERAAALCAAAVALLDLLVAPPYLLGVVSAAGAVCAAWRMRTWGGAHTLRTPLLWILHAGSAWIVVGLALRAATAFTLVPFSAGLHALTAGAIGSLTLGMMTRVGLGHTGRLLAVPPRMTLAFMLVLLGALVRVLAPVLFPGVLAALAVAGTVWSTAFAVYLVTYAPALVTPRVDGKPG